MTARACANRNDQWSRLSACDARTFRFDRKIPVLAAALAILTISAGTAWSRPMTPDEHGLPSFGATHSERSPYADILTQNRLVLPPVMGGHLSDVIRSPAWPVIFEDDFGPSRISTPSGTFSPWLPDSGSIIEWRRLQGFRGPRTGGVVGRSKASGVALADPETAQSDSEFVLSLIAEIENPTIQSLAVRVVQPTVDARGVFKLSVPGIWSPPTRRTVAPDQPGPGADRLVTVLQARDSPSPRNRAASPLPDDFGDLPVRSALVLAIRILNFITDPFVVATIFAIAVGLAALRIAQQIGAAKRRRHRHRHRYHLRQQQGEQPRSTPSWKHGRETAQGSSKPHRRRRSSRRGRYHLRRRRTPSTASVRSG